MWRGAGIGSHRRELVLDGEMVRNGLAELKAGDGAPEVTPAHDESPERVWSASVQRQIAPKHLRKIFPKVTAEGVYFLGILCKIIDFIKRKKTGRSARFKGQSVRFSASSATTTGPHEIKNCSESSTNSRTRLRFTSTSRSATSISRGAICLPA